MPFLKSFKGARRNANAEGEEKFYRKENKRVKRVSETINTTQDRQPRLKKILLLNLVKEL